MQAFVISLNSDPFRLKRFYDNLPQRLNVIINDVEAIDTRRFNMNQMLEYIEEDDAIRIGQGIRTHHYELTAGAIGCFLSHRLIWDKGSDLVEEQPFIIFEDDAYMTRRGNHNAIQEAWANAPNDCDILFLGAIFRDDDGTIINHSWFNQTTYVKMNAFYQTHAYVLTPHTAKKLMVLSEGKIRRQVDWFLSDLSDVLSIYCLKDDLFIQINSESTMQLNGGFLGVEPEWAMPERESIIFK